VTAARVDRSFKSFNRRYDVSGFQGENLTPDFKVVLPGRKSVLQDPFQEAIRGPILLVA
jgi:hypothetical protein